MCRECDLVIHECQRFLERNLVLVSEQDHRKALRLFDPFRIFLVAESEILSQRTAEVGLMPLVDEMINLVGA